VAYGKDIVLCVTHFKVFHCNEEYFMGTEYIGIGKGHTETNKD